jgi:plastocyanin
MRTRLSLFWLVFSFTLFDSACQTKQGDIHSAVGANPQSIVVEQPLVQIEDAGPSQVEFTLQTGVVNGRISYIGVGGDIDGLVNPDLQVQPKDAVKITLINGDGMTHNLFLPDFGVKTSLVNAQGETATVRFTIGESQNGIFAYYCTQPGHRQAGQEGRLIVVAAQGTE